MAGGQERILKRRIKTVQATKKITRAMELIAASRIARAQERVRQAVPYSEQITEVVKDLAAAAGAEVRSPLLEPRPDVRREAFLVLVADRGLCGGYNSSVLRAAEGEVKRIALEGKEYGLISVGRKAETYFRFRGYHTEASFTGFSERPTYADAKAIATSVMGMYERGEIDRLEIIYTRFISAGVQEVLQRPLIPLDRDVVEGGDAMPATVDGHAGPQASYEFEPSPDAILDTPVAPLRRGPHLRRVAQRVGVRAGGSAACDEGRDRQRRGPHHQPVAHHEPRPPGRDHHRDHGDRRRRRGAQVRRSRRAPCPDRVRSPDFRLSDPRP